MKEYELLPCPFCGSENVMLEPYRSRKGYEATVFCNGGCLGQMHTITYDTQEEAIDRVIRAWNKRDDIKTKIAEIQEKSRKFSYKMKMDKDFEKFIMGEKKG